MKNKIPVFYSPEQSLDRPIGLSPSPMKPKLLARYWKLNEKPVTFKSVIPITREVYYKAHDREYVDSVLDGTVPNGFGNFDADVLSTLPYLTGSVIQAGEYVIDGKSQVAFSLSSGSHHSCYSSGGGFCTFNHNVTAAIFLKEKYKLNKVGFLDLDCHYGNGDADIKNQLNLDWLKIYSFGGEGISSENAKAWLQTFHQTCLSFEGCDLVFFNAGVDPHIYDDLGGVLTTQQMKRRDAIVLETMKLLNIPCVITSAGGYAFDEDGYIKPVLDLHTQTLDEAERVFLTRSK